MNLIDPTSNVTFDVGSFDDGIDNWPSVTQVNEMIGMYPHLKLHMINLLMFTNL